MARTAPCALLLQSYWENPRMRAVRISVSRGPFLESPETLRSFSGVTIPSETQERRALNL